MPQTLAQLIRAKHPGVYDDMDDLALESAVRRKYPGTYDDLPRTEIKPARAEDFMPKAPEGSALGRFASGVWSAINPIPAIKQVSQATAEEFGRAQTAASKGDYYGALLHGLNAQPVTTVGRVLIGAGKAQIDQFGKAADAAGQGRYSEMAGHGAAGLLPLVGPVAANAGEQIGRGDVSGGLGAATGLIAGVAVTPAAVARGARAASAGVRSPLRNRNAVEAEAVRAGQAAGVPMDAATATGNRAIGAVQHMADRSLGGSMVAERAAEAQARGLATMGEQLAAKGYGSATTAEQAGEAVRGAVRSRIRKHAADADTEYEKLRAIENDPASARQIDVEPKPGTSAAAEGRAVPGPRGRFSKAGASTEDLWQGVLGDARRNGFKGSADDLKAEFMDRLRSARELKADMAEGAAFGSDEALLRDIRELGGLKPYEMDRGVGTARKMRGEFETLGQSSHTRSVMRTGGLEYDDLLDQLKQGGRWPDLTDVRDLQDRLNTIARRGPEGAGSGDFEHLLAATGVKPGAKWWEGSSAAKAETMQLPVDLRAAKEALGPTYEALRREAQLVPLMGDKARALTALDRLIGGPDHAPLSVVDSALGELKAFARSDVPELRSVGQGAAARAVKQLDDWVKLTAESAGPEAIAALEAGRKSTVAKYGAADVFNGLDGVEPAVIFRKMTAQKDGAIDQLRAIAKQAPAELPKVGRAFLDDLLGQATAGGGFGHGAAIANKWQNLGLETKRLLFNDPAYIKELDNFFHLARMTAKNANPSGTAHAMAAASQGGMALGALTGVVEPITAVAALVGPAAVSKFLHSPAGVKLLSEGFRIPLGNTARRGAWAAEVAALAGKAGATNPSGFQMQPAPAR